MPERLPNAIPERPLQVNELFSLPATAEQVDAINNIRSHFVNGSDRFDSEATQLYDMHHGLFFTGTAIGKNSHYEYVFTPSEKRQTITRTTDAGVEKVEYSPDENGKIMARWRPSAHVFKNTQIEGRFGRVYLEEVVFNPDQPNLSIPMQAATQRLAFERIDEIIAGFAKAIEAPKETRLKRLGRALLRGGAMGSAFKH